MVLLHKIEKSQQMNQKVNYQIPWKRKSITQKLHLKKLQHLVQRDGSCEKINWRCGGLNQKLIHIYIFKSQKD